MKNATQNDCHKEGYRLLGCCLKNILDYYLSKIIFWNFMSASVLHICDSISIYHESVKEYLDTFLHIWPICSKIDRLRKKPNLPLKNYQFVWAMQLK